MRVKKGDTVKITFTNNNGTHDLLIDEFKVNTGRIPAGESKTVEFVADKTGTFEYYCSVGQHRKMGMKGNLIVE
jgi:nitrite reductase (NO-forming)